MLKLHADIAVECGMNKNHTFVCENGDVLTLLNHQVFAGGQVPADAIYIDGKSTVSVSTSVLRDRSMLIAEGMVGVYLIIDPKSNRLVSAPVVESKGFISSNKRGLQKKASEVIGLEVSRLMSSGKKVTYSDIKQTVRTITSHFLYREAHRTPMVIPVILNYGGNKGGSEGRELVK